jgi:glycosyltransferase involved in cell wall biosynthesis
VLLDVMAMIRKARPSWPIGLIVGNDGPLVGDAMRLGVSTTILPFPRDFAQLGDAGLASPATWASFAGHALGGSLSTLRYIQQLRRVVAEFRPDIVHSNGIKMHLLGALARPGSAALIWHFHDYPSARPVTNLLIKTLKSRCAAVVAVSDSVKSDIRQQLGPTLRIETIWNSVDLDRFTPTGAMLDLDALANLPLAPAGVPRIGLVATFARWKGHLLFLDMVQALLSETRVAAYIVGGPLYETQASQFSIEELRGAIASRGLEGSVGLTGFVNDPAAALRSLDVVVHASTSDEPFGLVIAEAMAAGRAVVISDKGGVAELVEPGVTGLTYRSGQIGQLTATVRRLIDDPALRDDLGRRARPAAVAQFHPDRVTAQMLDLYERVERDRAA